MTTAQSEHTIYSTPPITLSRSDAPCDNCERYDLPRVGIYLEGDQAHIAICPICLADAIEAVTGWKLGNVIRQYYAVMMAAAVIRSERKPKRGPGRPRKNPAA